MADSRTPPVHLMDDQSVWPNGPSGGLGRWSAGDVHGLAVRQVLKTLREGDHRHAVHVGIGRLREAGQLTPAEEQVLTQWSAAVHRADDTAGLGVTELYGRLRAASSLPSPVAVAIIDIAAGHVRRLGAPSRELPDGADSLFGMAVLGGTVGHAVQGTPGAVLGVIVAAAVETRRAHPHQVGNGVQDSDKVSSKERVLVQLDQRGPGFSAADVYRELLESWSRPVVREGARRAALAGLRDDALLTESEHSQLAGVLDEMQDGTAVAHAFQSIVELHDRFMLSAETSPAALVIAGIARDSAVASATGMIDREVAAEDVGGAIDGARDGLRVGGYIGHPLSGAVVGAIVRGVVASASAAKD